MAPCFPYRNRSYTLGINLKVQAMQFHVRRPVRLLDYTVPCQKSSPFRLCSSMSEVQSVFQIIPFHVKSHLSFRLYDSIRFHVRSPLHLLDYAVPCQKSSPPFRLCGSMSEVHSVFQIIRFHIRSPVRLLDYTVPYQKSTPSFRLYTSMSEVLSVLDYTVPCQKSSPSFGLYGSMSEVPSVSQIIRFHVRSPLHLLDYTFPCQKSTPSFRLYCSMSEVHSVF